jgi:DnaJ-class molecular chaperone
MGLVRFILYCAVAYFVWRYLKSLVQSSAWSRPRVEAAPPLVQSPHEILGVSPGASADEIRAAYQRLVMQYHPDRVSGMGPEIVAVAERKTKEINQAYAQLKS